MDDFRMIATVLSMVLGLGVTRILLGLVTVFRTRARSRPDWLTLTWAGIVFAAMLEFWWAINQLAAIRTDYTFADFFFLVILTMLLFLAAALVLPSRSEDEDGSLRGFFERDGRYGLLALSGFFVVALAVNVFYFGESVASVWGILDVPVILGPCAVFLARPGRTVAWLTVLYLPLFALDLWASLAA